jgi:beta-N-acetylhexosaminidase
MLWPSYGYMDELEKRITLGEIPVERLDEAAGRVWALKKRLGILSRDRPLLRKRTIRERAFAASTARKICEGAVTLVRDRKKTLPLRPVRDRKLLLVGIAPSGLKPGKSSLEKLSRLKSLLEARGFRVDYKHNLPYEDQGWQDSVTAIYDRIVFVVVRSPHQPIGPLGLFAEEAQSAWAINAMPKDKVVVISFGSPYVGNEYFERTDVYINAYSNVDSMHEAVVRALVGEIPFQGISPVDLGQTSPHL